MKITRVGAKEYAEKQGLTQTQIDGIPEGFAWIKDGITIGNKSHEGHHVILVPNADWSEGIIKGNDLVELFKSYYKILDKK